MATLAPTAPPGEGVLPLGLARLVHRTFPPGTDSVDDPFSARHFGDLARLYDVPLRDSGVEGGPDLARGNSFATMVRALLAELAPRGTPVDIAVVAHATPDLDCRLAAVTTLSETVPGEPLSFAVSDCGSASPFAALHLMSEYVRRHGYRSAALFALDQATLPYETGSRLAGDAGTALLLTRADTDSDPGSDSDSDGVDGCVLRRATDVAPGEVAEALRAELAAAGAADPALPLVAGPSVDPERHLPGRTGRVVRAAPGLPASGALGALDALAHAEARAEERRAAGRVAVVDYEPGTGDLSVLLLEPGARGGPR